MIDYDLDGKPAIVVFSFDDNDSLDEVRLLSDGWRNRKYTDRIFLALKRRYGEPNEIKAEGTLPDRIYTWDKKRTLVKFTVRDWHDGDINLELSYQRGSQSATDKL